MTSTDDRNAVSEAEDLLRHLRCARTEFMTMAGPCVALMQPEDLGGLPVAETRERNWLSTKQAAEYLEFSGKQIHALPGPHTDARPVHRLVPGGERRFNLAGLEEWLLAR